MRLSRLPRFTVVVVEAPFCLHNHLLPPNTGKGFDSAGECLSVTVHSASQLSVLLQVADRLGEMDCLLWMGQVRRCRGRFLPFSRQCVMVHAHLVAASDFIDDTNEFDSDVSCRTAERNQVGFEPAT